MTQVNLAAKMLLEDQEAGIAEISKKDGKFVWKDSYVFLMNLDGKMLAHPFKPGLTRMDNLLSVSDKNLENPKMLFLEFVELARTNGEGWVEYMWPKPHETAASLKETYLYRIPGTRLFAGAGIYK